MLSSRRILSWISRNQHLLSSISNSVTNLAASSYARLIFRSYSVENGRLDSTSGAVPSANIMPQANTSLHDILKGKFGSFKGLEILKNSPLTWGDVETIKASVDNRAQFEEKLEKRLTQFGINEGEAGLFADFLTVIAFPSQTPSPAADSSKLDASQLSVSDQVFMNEISSVLLNPKNLSRYRDLRFKTAEECFNSMGWQIGVSAYTAGVRDNREDAIAYIVAGILLRDGLRAHLGQTKEEKVFCEAIKEEEAAVKNIVNELEERINKHTTSDNRKFDTFLAVSASPGMGKSALINLLCESVKNPGFINGLQTKVISAIDQFPGGARIPKTIAYGFDKFVSKCNGKIYVCATTFNGSTPTNENILGLGTNLALRALYDVVKLPKDFNFNKFQDILPKESRMTYLSNALEIVKAVTKSDYVILATDELMNLNSVVQNPKNQLAMLSDCFVQPQFEFLFSSLMISPLNTFSFNSGFKSVVIPLETLTQIKTKLLDRFAEKIFPNFFKTIGHARFIARSILAASQYHGRTLESLWNGITVPTLKSCANLISPALMDVDYEQTRNALLAIAIKKCTDASMTSSFAAWQSLVSSGILISHTTGKQYVIPMISLFCLFSEENMLRLNLAPFRKIVDRGPVQNGVEFEKFVHLWEIGRRELILELFPSDKMTLSKLYHLSDVAQYRHRSSVSAWDIEIEMWRTMEMKYMRMDKDDVSDESLDASIRCDVAEWNSLTDKGSSCYLMKSHQVGFDTLSCFKIKGSEGQVVLATEVKSNLATTTGKGQEVEPEDVIDKIKLTSEALCNEIDKGNEVCFLMLCSCKTAGTIEDMFAHQISNADTEPIWKVKLREYSAGSRFMHVFQRSVVLPRAAVHKLVGPSLDNLLYDPANK